MLDKAKWIENPRCEAEVAPVFKKTFVVSDYEKAKIVVCGLGFYTLHVNKKRVSDELLTPPFTAYDKTVYYQTYDLTTYLKKGENTIEITCGNGWLNELDGNS